MKHGPELRNKILGITSEIYKSSIEEFGLAAGTDMSRSDKCHTLTYDLMSQLQVGGYPVRRELHMDEADNWHYIIAHGRGEPSDLDIITDLNPWFFGGDAAAQGPLHGVRSEVMDILRYSNVDEQYVALRGLTTIILPHTEKILSSYTHPPLPIPHLSY